MGRGTRAANAVAASAATPQQRKLLQEAADAPPAEKVIDGPELDLLAGVPGAAKTSSGDDLFGELVSDGVTEPDWRTPNDYLVNEAREFSDPANAERGGLPLEPAIAARLLKLRFDGDFKRYSRWYQGAKSAIKNPRATVPGMMEAGETISESLRAGETIAVYCDFDVDGTSAGEILRRSLTPYMTDPQTGAQAKLLYGYADAQRGFGLTNAFVEEAREAGAKLLITLDCGSSQVSQTRLAQSYGMRVIIVDHHGVDKSNPAEHHLNPRLYEPRTSYNTGAQLAWKLGSAVQLVRDGRTRPEHWETTMWAAAAGFMADMESVLLEENRAFAWGAANHPAPGVAALARHFGEDPTTPGGLIRSQAVMNLPKRTPLAHASDVGALWAAESEEEARPIIDKLLAIYREAQPHSQAMKEAAVLQTGERRRLDDGTSEIPDPDQRVAFAVLDGYEDYNGYSGVVANAVSSRVGKPTFVLTRKGIDEHGQELYRFSSRNSGTGIDAHLGELDEREDFLRACTIKRYNESDEIIEAPACGGHEEVMSGTVTRENIPALKAAVDKWAGEHRQWYPAPYYGPEAFLSARKVPADRLSIVEEQARRLGPYTRDKQMVDPKRPDYKEKHKEVTISVEGTLIVGEPDPDRPQSLIATLDLGDGVTREARWPADQPVPTGRREYVLRVGKQLTYWLRTYH